MIRRVAMASALLFVSSTAYAAQRYFADVTGTWKISVQTPDNSTESTATFTQKGDSLTGSITGELIGTRPIVGTVKGDTVRFDFSFDMQGTVLDIRAGGLLKDKDSIDGEMALPGGMGTFPFSGKRQP